MNEGARSGRGEDEYKCVVVGTEFQLAAVRAAGTLCFAAQTRLVMTPHPESSPGAS